MPGRPGPLSARTLGDLLRKLADLQFAVTSTHESLLLLDETAELRLARQGGLQLRLRHAALHLAAAQQHQRRRLAPAGGRARGSIPSCVDLSQFLGGWNVDTVLRTREPESVHKMLVSASALLNTLNYVWTAAGEATCSRCAPQQLLLVLGPAMLLCGQEAATAAEQQEEAALQKAALDMVVFIWSRLGEPAWQPWLPAFRAAAVAMLSAWLQAAAPQLRAARDRFAASATDSSPSSRADADSLRLALAYQAQSVQQALRIVLEPGGGQQLGAPGLHGAVPLEQLLAWCELVLRIQAVCQPDDPKMLLGLSTLKVGGWAGGRGRLPWEELAEPR